MDTDAAIAALFEQFFNTRDGLPNGVIGKTSFFGTPLISAYMKITQYRVHCLDRIDGYEDVKTLPLRFREDQLLRSVEKGGCWCHA
jgi:hypothetical protein